MMILNMNSKQTAIYAARGNLREARYARLEGRIKKADWHLALAATYRRAAMANTTGSAA